MKFSEFKYERPNMLAAAGTLSKLKGRVKKAKNADEVCAAIKDLSAFQAHLMTAISLSSIRHTIDTSDKFYEKEHAFFDTVLPLSAPLQIALYKALLKTPYKSEVDERFGSQYMRLAKQEYMGMSPKLMGDMIKCNKLVTEYQKILASCKINFHGETCNLSGMRRFAEDPDRDIRREAARETSAFFTANEEKLDEIYDKLVKLRTGMGQKLGYDNFIPLGYLNMGRTWLPEDASTFRAQVAEKIVPLCTELHKKQAARIGVDKLMIYDEGYQFTSGNAKPAGDKDFMVDCAKRMYRELSKETGEFFDDMVERQLMDLETKPNKRVGGYCSALPDFNAPFIFSNFNGTSADVDVLTHEAGHAFAGATAGKHQQLIEYLTPTMEAAEIHSMSMEFFTSPWMELFFGEAADKYRYSHLLSSLTFVPYGVCVDEFQHTVYEKPALTPKERKAAWRELEAKYLPDRDYDGDAFMEGGGFWQKQHHIYGMPFYYIDYTLASMGAFEFYGKMKADREAAWADYLALCGAGGSLPYRELLKKANLADPFTEGGVEKAISAVVNALFTADDKALDK